MKNLQKTLILLIVIILIWIIYQLYYTIIWKFIDISCSTWFWFQKMTYDSWFLEFINQYKVGEFYSCSSTYRNIIINPWVTLTLFLLFVWSLLFPFINNIFHLKWKYSLYYTNWIALLLIILIATLSKVPLGFN
jgi:hypothetical protein